MLVAGHDTTGYTLAWTLVELARNPPVQERLLAELDAANPGRGPWGPERLGGLVCLGGVIKEAMRLWPVAALGSGRVVEGDLPAGEFTVPRGAETLLPFFVIHRTGIERPDEFVPERWEDPAAADALGRLFLPFASGRRNCVGQNLAMLELRMVLAALVQRFSVALAPGAEVTAESFLTMRPAGALLLARPRP
uniref:Cytochrome P450 n=1 Tax=Cryptomonas curvata TaxID=233186 RepID=A0A7S0QJV4_9CRYP|mmetsp:Transcript_29799/g.62477  ORF Transcript_29799/g.62477 Transcript_29799/m.62477 type:complete len:193 (+) Transcript_29799:96-674(+)